MATFCSYGCGSNAAAPVLLLGAILHLYAVAFFNFLVSSWGTVIPTAVNGVGRRENAANGITLCTSGVMAGHVMGLCRNAAVCVEGRCHIFIYGCIWLYVGMAMPLIMIVPFE
jgi:hypothetical protein